MDLEAIQEALGDHEADGWLFYDYHNRDEIAYRILGLEFGPITANRWYYYIPTQGEPVKLVNAVEPAKLDSLPGRKIVYVSWQEMYDDLKKILAGSKKVFMQYSYFNKLPMVSSVDGGTIEMIRSLDVEIISSAELVQLFEAVTDEAGYESHVKASNLIHQIKDEAFAEISKAVREGRKVNEYEIQQFIDRRYQEEGLTHDGISPAIVGINEHPANPHFFPTQENAYIFEEGQTVLIDIFGRLDEPDSIWADFTWCGYIGQDPPAKYVEIFGVVVEARDAALKFIEDAFARGETIRGFQVDDVARGVVKAAGYGDQFVHATGHSISRDIHGNGVWLDNRENHDDRPLVPGICFSDEPGIYFEGEMAVRSEIDIFIRLDGTVEVPGPKQQELLLL